MSGSAVRDFLLVVVVDAAFSLCVDEYEALPPTSQFPFVNCACAIPLKKSATRKSPLFFSSLFCIVL